MRLFVIVMWVVGGLAVMGAIGSFMDGRKVDRRFKNGYKNNAGSDVDPAMGVKLIKTAVACFVIAYVTQWIIDP